MRRERRRLQARRIWEELKPQWSKLKERLYTRYVTNLGWNVLHERLFLNKYDNRWYYHPILYNSTMQMQTRGNGFNSRSTMLHRYDAQSKGYTGAKCWQTYVTYACPTIGCRDCMTSLVLWAVIEEGVICVPCLMGLRLPLLGFSENTTS